MKIRHLKEASEFLGVVAVVASLVFVGVQLRQSRDIALSSNDGSYLQSRIDAYSLINQYADTWIRGNAGEHLDEPDSTIFRNLVRVLNESVFVDHIQQTRHGEESSARVVMHDFAAFLHQNPGARREWLDMEDNQIEYRKRLVTDGNVVSFWREGILADLAILDRGNGDSQPTAR